MTNGFEMVFLGGLEDSDFMPIARKLTCEGKLVLMGRGLCGTGDPLVEVCGVNDDMFRKQRGILKKMHHISDRLHIVNGDNHNIGYYSDISYAVLLGKKITMESYHPSNMVLIESLLTSLRAKIREDLDRGRDAIDDAWFLSQFGYIPSFKYSMKKALNWAGILLNNIIEQEVRQGIGSVRQKMPMIKED